MKKIKFGIMYLFFPLFLLFGINGCLVEPGADLNLEQEAVSVENYDARAEINILSDGNWTAAVSETWCSIAPRSGNGDGTITVTAMDNYKGESRTAVLTVASNGNVKKVNITQDYPRLDLDSENLLFDKTAGTKILKITSNTKWSLEIPDQVEWLTASKLSGTGDADVIFTVQANTSGPSRSSVINVFYGAIKSPLTVTQRRSFNNPPSIPAIIYPQPGESNVNTIPCFKWNASEDVDGDVVTYTVSYSSDDINWTDVESSSTEVYLKSHLLENTNYTWKITAEDSEGGKSETLLYSFTTGLKSGYADGEFKIHKQATMGVGGAATEILFLGDGYTAADFQEGGAFESDITEGVGYILGVEPVNTYKEYITIIKQAAYSQERGATEADKDITRNTVFSTSFNGGSAISVSEEKVYQYARMVTGSDEDRLKRLLIIVVINHDRYAGTTYVWTDGSAIALVPVSRTEDEGYKYDNVLVHEAIGHGLGGLADEYVSYQGQTLPESNKSEAETWMEHGFFRNIDFISDPTFIKWKYFFQEEGYSRVGIYEGAYYYSYGAWRSEVSSCMVDNELYFNAPSREAIVKRILERSGNTFDREQFLQNDIQKSPSATVQAYTKSATGFKPLAPPKLMYGK
jgi:hypothetical protein